MEESRHGNRSFDPVRAVQLPKALQTAYAIEGLTFRPFGIAENDLEVDFGQPSLPALVTDILECCATAGGGKAPERNLLWELRVGTRIECLLRIINLSGAFAAPFALRCRNSACGEPLEVELSLDDLLSLQDEPTDLLTVQCGEQALALRKPSGADQRGWAAGVFEDELTAIQSMVNALIRLLGRCVQRLGNHPRMPSTPASELILGASSPGGLMCLWTSFPTAARLRKRLVSTPGHGTWALPTIR